MMRSSRKLVPNFCETTGPDNPNEEVFGQLLEQVQCMYQKMMGQRAAYYNAPDMPDYSNDFRRFEDQIRALEQMNEDLMREIECLKAQLKQADELLEEEARHIQELECEIAGLKLELNATDAELCIMTAERDKLLRQLQEMCSREETYQQQIQALGDERDDLHREMRCISSQQVPARHGVNNYQSALADCCATVDSQTLTIGKLHADINKLNREIDDLIKERDALAAKLECMKRKYETEKLMSDEIIQKLKEQIECLKQQQLESCKKFECIIKAHHDELDRVERERIKYRNMYHEEVWKREELERKLKECEERKRRDKGGSGSGGGAPPPPPSGPGCGGGGGMSTQNFSFFGDQQSHGKCDQFTAEIERLIQEKINFENTRQCMETQIFTLTTQNTNLTQQLQDVFSKLEDLQEKHNSKNVLDENNNTTLQELLEKSEESKKALEHHVNQLQQQVKAAEACKTEKEKEVLALESRNSIHVEKIDTYLQEIKRIKEKYEAKMKEMQQKYAKDLEKKLAKQEREFQQEIAFLKQKPVEHAIKKVESIDFGQTTSPDVNDNGIQADDDVTIPTLINAKRSLLSEIKKLKKMVNERDEHIASMQTSMNEIKKKYSDQYKQLRLQKIQMDGAQTVLERQEVQLQIEREKLERDTVQFGQELKNLETERQKHQEYLNRSEKDRQTLESLAKTKDKIEQEVGMLKEAISKDFVDKGTMQQLKMSYEVQLADLQNKFESQLEMNRQLAEINEQLGKQFKDRDLINQMRDSNEEILRRELREVITGAKMDAERLRKIINERDEEVASLRKIVQRLKNRYSSASQKNEELVRHVHYLASASPSTVNILEEDHDVADADEQGNNN